METESLYLNFATIGFSPIDANGIAALVISLILLCISSLISAGEVAFFSLDPQAQDEISNNNRKSDRKILHLPPVLTDMSLKLANNGVRPTGFF